MQITMSILAVITAGHGAYRLVVHVGALSDAIADETGGLVDKLKDVGRKAGLSALAAVQVMAGACLLILQMV
jgi:hypothetical protein